MLENPKSLFMFCIYISVGSRSLEASVHLMVPVFI